MDRYYKAREIVCDLLKKDLFGYIEQNEIIVDTLPDNYYVIGRLFPQKSEVSQEDQDVSGTEDGYDTGEQPVSLYQAFMPSSMAISFTVDCEIEQLQVDYEFAWYEPHRVKVDDKHSVLQWHRNSKHGEEVIPLDTSFKPLPIHDGLELQMFLQKAYADGTRTFSVAMVNTYPSESSPQVNNQHTYFQPSIRIKGIGDNKNVFVEKKQRVEMARNTEVTNLELLYRHQHVFATGHGCSVAWIAEDQHASSVYTAFIPEHELLLVKPSGDVPRDVLGFKFLAHNPASVVADRLNVFANSYEAWILERKDEISKLPDKLITVAKDNIEKAIESLARIREGIILLIDDKDSYQAFQLVNQAMLRQREQRKGVGKADSDGWYPFQLAFILQELPSIAHKDDIYRETVDLLWFPTGGGKTEAYLGLAAFTIFLRRIRATSGGSSGAGVTVLMRYTLRLLTLQQFERASGLICACELLRRDNAIILGDEEISTGLWVGGGLTPNSLKAAKANLNTVTQHGFDALPEDRANPCQILTCPWCGESIRPAHYSCDGDRMSLSCPGTECPFGGGLPIYLIDEDLYNLRPSLIVATLDKYARMTWEPKVGRLFGLDNEQISPPELIIQDELHLISGPLGTVSGLYEVAVDKFCSDNGIRAKIIASTATIRNAKGQINSLYGRDFRQFPAQGLDMRDSFFAEESKRDEKPSRCYVGIMASGVSGNTIMIRVYAIIIFATRYLKDLGFSDSEIDSFWTMTGYFNSLRQLGGAVVNIIDDVQGRLKYLKGTKFKNRHPPHSTPLDTLAQDELTSNKANSEIGKTLKQLETKYPSPDALDVILASNMLSVGIDIGRLGLMVMLGQPKANSEYIQATSRVGRQTPGLVITIYDASRSRDRSHYEQFISFHSSLYRFVEATSLTPFAERARDRALHAVLISLVRHLCPDLRENSRAGNAKDHVDELARFADHIVSQTIRVDNSEVESTREQLEEIIEQWLSLSKSRDLVYQAFRSDGSEPLLVEATEHLRDGFPTLNSMRNVDIESDVFLEG